jgi:hypothetical protein
MTRSLVTGYSTSGGTVTVYWAGSAVKPTIYVSSTGAAKSNPITADFDGKYAFYVDDGHYKITNGTPTGDLTDVRISYTAENGQSAKNISVLPYRGNTASLTQEAFNEALLDGTLSMAGGTFTGAIATSGAITTTSTTTSSNIDTGSIITDGGVGIAKTLYVGETGNFAGQLNAAATTASTTTLTGALITAGGVGVVKGINVGENIAQISANGASWTHGQVSELLTLTADATNHDSVANLLPANSVIEAVTGRVTTAITGGTKAVGTITMSGIAVADETFVVGAQTFTWKASRGAAGQVTIGANAAAAVTNIVAAITADLATVTAADGAGDTVVVTAVTGGTAGNSLTFTEASTNMSMDGAGVLGGTTPGANVSSWTLADPSTAARFASANTTLSTSGNSIGINHWKGGVASDGAGPTQVSAAKVRITTDTVVQGGAVRITVFYRQFVAPTS